DLRADSVVAQILLEAELQIRLDRVEPLVLQGVRLDFIGQPDPAAFLVEINYHAGIGAKNPLDRFSQLLAAIASIGPENVAGQALRVQPHQRRFAAADIALDQRQMLTTIDRAAKDDRLQLARTNRKIDVGNALDQQLVGQAVRHQILDEQHRDVVFGG